MTSKNPETSTGAGSEPLRRAFAVIELLALNPTGLTASEVSEHLNLSLVTSFRLLQRLRDLGLVEGEAGRNARNVVGARLHRLAQSLTGHGTIVEAAREVTREVANSLDMVVYIAGLFEFEAYLLAVDLPAKAEVPLVHPGRQFKIHASAGGKALMAFQPQWVMRRFLSKPLDRFTANTITDPHKFLAHLAEIRERGYAISAAESDNTLWGMAVPIPEGSGTVSFCLGVVTFLARVTEEPELVKKCADQLRAAAQRISGSALDQISSGYNR